MDSIAIVALSLGSMGFIFGMAAMAQVAQIKKEVQQLRSQLEDE